ncbi:MAG: beta-galactosidase [Spartobacteria bacterium]
MPVSKEFRLAPGNGCRGDKRVVRFRDRPRRSAVANRLGAFLAAAVIFTFGVSALAGPKASASGIIYLLRADRADAPLGDLAQQRCWSNPHVDGILLRTHWNRIQPSPDEIDWSFFDEGVALAAQHQKKVGLLVTAGVTTPLWVYSAGAHSVTVRQLRRGKKSSTMQQPLPWDPVFQAKWSEVVRQLGTRYDSKPEVAYVIMGGPGRKAEAFFVSTPGEIAAFNEVGGLPSWIEGVKWITDQYAKYLPATPFLLDLGAPVPSASGRNALRLVCAYGAESYPHRFGVKSDGLTANYKLSSIGALQVEAMSSTTTVGFQMLLPFKGKSNLQGTPLLAGALSLGSKLGAHFVEVYAVDCDDSRNAAILDKASDRLKSARKAVLSKPHF